MTNVQIRPVPEEAIRELIKAIASHPSDFTLEQLFEGSKKVAPDSNVYAMRVLGGFADRNINIGSIAADILKTMSGGEKRSGWEVHAHPNRRVQDAAREAYEKYMGFLARSKRIPRGRVELPLKPKIGGALNRTQARVQ